MGASLGLSAALFSAIGIGASVGSSLLAKKPKAPQNTPESYNRLRANIDPRTPRKSAVGITALNTDIRDEEFTDSQTYFHRFIVVASHAVEEISEIWFDDKLAWSLAGGVASEFSGYLTVAPILEGNAGNAINISARMGSTRRFTGCAYVHLRYKLTGNTKKTDSPFAQSITTRITIRGKGAPFYDPAKDSTVAGGSGSHRADDQSTWEWDDDRCRNPALARLFNLLGWKINGLLAVGRGIPPARIDLESFAIAANICDEEVDDGDGGTEPRYRCDGVWSEGDHPNAIGDMINATMNADLDDVGGKLRLTVFHNDLATPDADFTDADILGDFVWEPAPPLDQTFNVVRGTFTDASDAALYQQVDYPEVRADSPDGIERVEPFDLPLVQSNGQAQRLAGLKLARQLYGGGTFKAEYQATAWAVQKNSVIRQTFSPEGWANKLFRVAEMDIQVDGVVPLTLREEHASIYSPPTLQAPIDPVAATSYDPALDPVIGAISDLSVQIVGPSSITIFADYAGAVTSILPYLQGYKLYQDGSDVTAEAAWSVSVAAGTIGADIGAANGNLELDLSGGILTDAGIVIVAERNGVTKSHAVTVTKSNGLPAGLGGTGSKIANDNDFVVINSTSFVAITDVLTVSLATGESLYGTAALHYYVDSGSPVSRTATAKWQYSPTGAGTWSDFGTAIAGTAATGGYASESGYGEFTHPKSGLTPADYDVRLVAQLDANSVNVAFSGQAIIEAKI
jgi:hypothetical protein